jgi:uncharacterized protein
MAPDPAVDVIAATRAWIERAVVGLNLCPFAKAVYAKERIRYAVTDADSPDALAGILEQELLTLHATPAETVDTTLLIHPRALGDFLDFNDFLDVADATLERLGLVGVLQIASFHPRYRFAGTAPDDITNCTNRSPYPMLHLLREESIEQAVAAFPGADQIYLRNMETLKRLGTAGWDALGLAPTQNPEDRNG